MSSVAHQFYLARADEARSDAAKAVLDNVRERALRSAAAWEAMASRALRTETLRARREADKAEAAPSGAA